MLFGITEPSDSRRHNHDYPYDKYDKKVPKEVGILIHYDDGIDRIHVSNFSLHVDLEGDSLYWVGPAPSDTASLELITKLFDDASGKRARKELVDAAGQHAPSPVAFAFLKDHALASRDEDVRHNAVFWLGEGDYPAAAEMLLRVMRNDESRKVKENAVFGLSQM